MIRLSVIAFISIVLLLVFGAIAPAAAPITLTTPVSGSMEPTASEDSLVVVVDAKPSTGDIALFSTPDRSNLVLHRIVGTTDDGSAFITQGDANSQTDQKAGDSPVTPDEVTGIVPTVAGAPLIIPHVGMLLTNPVFIIGSWMLLGLSLFYSANPSQITSGTVNTFPVSLYATIGGLIVLVVLPTVILTTPATVSAEIITTGTGSAEASHIAAPGETTAHTVKASSPMMAFLHTSTHASGDLTIVSTESALGSSDIAVTVTNPPVEEPTVHESTITLYSYPAVLPNSIIQSLAGIHPTLAALATGLITALPLFIISIFTDSKRIVRASNRTISSNRRKRQSHVDDRKPR